MSVFTYLYANQLDFQRQLHEGIAPGDMPDVEKMGYLRTQAFALIGEVIEATDETGWKPWTTSNHINRDAYMSELADVFIFLMNLMIVGDITPRELLAKVKAKQIINLRRQAEGYDGVSTKCPGCKRAYDDDAVKCNQADPRPIGMTGWCDVKGEYVA